MENKNKKDREKAVAVEYDERRDNSPRVVAKGEGFLAQKIKEVAEQYGVPVHRDNALVELLAQIDVSREIPPELFGAVAEILAWIYRANESVKAR